MTTTRTKVELDKVEKTVDIQLKDRTERLLKMQLADAARERTGAPPTATWTDPAGGLMWTRKDNGSDVNWNQAMAYCSMLKLAGYSDWRLPTIDELQAIYDPGVSRRKKFDNSVTYNVHVKGNLELTGWQWSSNRQEAWHGWPWTFVFDRPNPEHGFPVDFSYSLRALCVRSSGE